MKVLIVGAGGQLGTELARCFKNKKSEIAPLPKKLINADVKYVDMPEFDITNYKNTKHFIYDFSPDVVINCAAYTNVDGCDTNQTDAMLVNSIGPRNLAIACQRISAKLIHVSTDYVFSGNVCNEPLSEYDVPFPKSTYGKTKLLGENYVQNNCKRSFIVRTAWLYGYVGKNFVKTIANAAKTRSELTVVNDQIGNPTNAQDLAHHLLKLAVSKEYGIYHCTGEGICSWYDFACEIVRLSGSKAKVLPCTSSQYKKNNPNAADRPAYSALENRMFACTTGNEMRNWKDALNCFFENWNGE